MNGHLTRRELVKRGAAGITVLSLPSFFASEAFAAAAAGIDPKKLGKSLTISNWPLYIDIN